MNAIDLTFLLKFTKRDQVKISRYISIYLKYSTELLEKMQEALAKSDAKNLAIHAHSLKPQAELIGVIGMKEKLVLIEDFSRKDDLDNMLALLEDLIDLNTIAASELTSYLSTS